MFLILATEDVRKQQAQSSVRAQWIPSAAAACPWRNSSVSGSLCSRLPVCLSLLQLPYQWPVWWITWQTALTFPSWLISIFSGLNSVLVSCDTIPKYYTPGAWNSGSLFHSCGSWKSKSSVHEAGCVWVSGDESRGCSSPGVHWKPAGLCVSWPVQAPLCTLSPFPHDVLPGSPEFTWWSSFKDTFFFF